MRLLVVAGSAPDNSRSTPRKRRIAAQPPGPGLGLQPPSVQISTTSDAGGPGVTVTCSEAIGVLVARGRWKRSRRRYSSGSLRVTSAPGGVFSQSIQPGQQEADRRTLAQHRQRRALGVRQRARRVIGARACARALVTLNEKSGSKHQAFRQTATS